MQSQFDDNPFDWDENTVLKFMQSIKIDKKFIETQQTLRYKGPDFLMYDENHLFTFYKASTPDEKNQLRYLSNNFNSQNLDDDNVVVSRPLNVTGQVDITDEGSVLNRRLDNSENHDIDIERSGLIKIYDLPYDPFDFDTTMNYEAAKNDFEGYLTKCTLYRSFQDFKSKRSLQRKGESQLVLEVKKTSLTGSNEQGASTVEKFAIKENQTVILGQQDMLLRDKAVSRKHILVENLNGVCNVQDLGSSCGTFIRIKNQQVQIKEGSIFECGFQEFQITSILAEGDSAKVKLKVTDGNEQHKGKSFDLNIQNRFLIGRDIRCHFGSQFSEDKDLSSYHAKLSIKDNVLSIMDLDSVKGTWLRLSPQRQESAKFQIQNDSEIKINPFIITVKINQMGDMFASNPSQINNGMCLSCKAVKSNIQVLPCQHVISCKECYQKMNYKTCPRPDCNTAIKSHEVLYNM